jgi:hypothetical protein
VVAAGEQEEIGRCQRLDDAETPRVKTLTKYRTGDYVARLRLVFSGGMLINY